MGRVAQCVSIHNMYSTKLHGVAYITGDLSNCLICEWVGVAYELHLDMLGGILTVKVWYVNINKKNVS